MFGEAEKDDVVKVCKYCSKAVSNIRTICLFCHNFFHPSCFKRHENYNKCNNNSESSSQKDERTTGSNKSVDTVLDITPQGDVNMGDKSENPELQTSQKVVKTKLDELALKKLRKKLKNRAAAKMARARRKMELQNMVKTILELQTKNDTLTTKCQELTGTNKKLSKKNRELRSRLYISNTTQKVSNPPSKNMQETLQEASVLVKKEVCFQKALTTQELAALWKEVSSVPLPQCSCYKLP